MRSSALLLILSATTALIAQAPSTPQTGVQTTPTTSAAKAPAQQQGSPVTLHANAKLVYVDVVVTDRDHHPVHDLKLQDFTVAEGGKPQTVSSFEEHKALSATEAAKIEPLPKLPPGTFTNYTAAPTNKAINILLLDALNTPLQDQMYVRQQLLAYLKNARPGTNVAIFGLSTKLVMLQGFTSNPEILKNVVDKMNSKASVLLDDAVGGGGMPDNASDANDAMGDPLPASVVSSMQTFMDITQSFQLMLRARYTLDAMNVLARYLAAIPGRKNLIWFSGSFPLDIMPDTVDGAADPFAAVADAEDEYRETTNLLARAQVAVYPIDARGLMVSPTMSATTSGSKYAHNPRAMANDETKFFNSSTSEHSTMDRMADDTGGHAFYNTNGLTEAVNKAVDDGANYYTFTYSPSNNVWKGDFRKIQVSLARQGYTLEYRHGYYADDPNSANSAVSNNPLEAAVDASGVNRDPGLIMRVMAHGVPSSSQILYKVRVIPTSAEPEDTLAPENIVNPAKDAAAKPPYRRYTVDYAALPGDFTFTVTPDGMRHTIVEFIAVVYQADGTVVNRTSHVLRASLSAEQIKRVAQTGFPFRQEISVPVKGDFSLRLGVHDLRSNRIGATEISVASVKNLQPLSAVEPKAAPATPAPTPAPAPNP